MKENKVKKQKNEPVYHSMDRMFLVTFPMTVSYLVLMLFGQIPPLSALIGFGLTLFFTFLLTVPFLKELEQLINYLKQEAEGRVNIQMPHFVRRGREAFKIVQSFNQIKLNWLNKNKLLEAQTLSDTAILQQLPEPLLMLDKQGIIVDTNISAQKIFGPTLLHKKISDLIKEDAFSKALNKILSNQTSQENVEFYIKIAGKKNYFKALLNWLPATAKNGAEVVVLLHDVTNFKILEKSQNAFFANASHELKTPLSVLSGFIETLQGPAKNDSDAREKFLNIMREQTIHMTDLVQDLLALSRLDLENDTPLENVSISELIRSVFQVLDLKAQKNGKELVLKENAIVAPIKARNAELFRVFQNLIDNAIKYGKPKTKITTSIDLETESALNSNIPSYIPTQQLVVKVHNKGKTIPAEEQPHIFERFYRMESNMNATGTGLGLAIASEIIHKYKGTISVESTPTKGTIFTVILPLGL